jgi:hypothetical protein
MLADGGKLDSDPGGAELARGGLADVACTGWCGLGVMPMNVPLGR